MYTANTWLHQILFHQASVVASHESNIFSRFVSKALPDPHPRESDDRPLAQKQFYKT